MAPGRGSEGAEFITCSQEIEKNGRQNVHERFEIIFQTYMYWKFVFTQTYCTNCWVMFIIV